MKKITEKLARVLVQHFDPVKEESRELLDPEHSPAEYLQQLMDNEYYEDAVILMAHALPHREAVWWGCLATRKLVEAMKTDDLACLQMAEKWVYEPNDRNRRICGNLAEKGGYKSAANWVAAAAFWSGGSIMPEGSPVVEPGPYLYAHAVAGAIMMAVGQLGPDAVVDNYNHFVQQGLNIADGKSE